MLAWGTEAQQSEGDAEFRERVTTDGDFTVTYAQVGSDEGADVYSHGGFVYLSRLDDQDDEHAVVLSASLMNQLARDWLRYKGWPWQADQ